MDFADQSALYWLYQGISIPSRPNPEKQSILPILVSLQNKQKLWRKAGMMAIDIYHESICYIPIYPNSQIFKAVLPGVLPMLAQMLKNLNFVA